MFFDLPLLLALAGFTYAVGGTAYLWFGLARVPRLSEVRLSAASASSGSPSGVAFAGGAAAPAASLWCQSSRRLAMRRRPLKWRCALSGAGLATVGSHCRQRPFHRRHCRGFAAAGGGRRPPLASLDCGDAAGGLAGQEPRQCRGVGVAKGEWLLFTDADVQLHPQILAKAMAHAATAGFDHIAAAPEARLPGGVLSQFALYFALLFSVWARPWAARNPRSRAHVGIGAFNLVRRSVYHRAGGHAAVRLCPDDDLELGRCLKLAGGRQDFVFANGLATVDWYGSWGEVRRGLMKNLFAGAGYSVPLCCVGRSGAIVAAGLAGAGVGADSRAHLVAELRTVAGIGCTRRSGCAFLWWAPLWGLAVAGFFRIWQLPHVALHGFGAGPWWCRVAGHFLFPRGIARFPTSQKPISKAY